MSCPAAGLAGPFGASGRCRLSICSAKINRSFRATAAQPPAHLSPRRAIELTARGDTRPMGPCVRWVRAYGGSVRTVGPHVRWIRPYDAVRARRVGSNAASARTVRDCARCVDIAPAAAQQPPNKTQRSWKIRALSGQRRRPTPSAPVQLQHRKIAGWALSGRKQRLTPSPLAERPTQDHFPIFQNVPRPPAPRLSSRSEPKPATPKLPANARPRGRTSRLASARLPRRSR